MISVINSTVGSWDLTKKAAILNPNSIYDVSSLKTLSRHGISRMKITRGLLIKIRLPPVGVSPFPRRLLKVESILNFVFKVNLTFVIYNFMYLFLNTFQNLKMDSEIRIP